MLRSPAGIRKNAVVTFSGRQKDDIGKTAGAFPATLTQSAGRTNLINAELQSAPQVNVRIPYF